MRWFCSSRMTSRSGSTTSSVSCRPVMRSASNSITDLELLARHALVIGGVVVGGEGVLLRRRCAATDLREAPGRILRRALEHQMFEEVREPRLARRLVGGADLVPDHVGDHRRAVVGNDDQLQAVRQREVGDLGARRLGRKRRRREREPATSDRRRGETIRFRWHDFRTCADLSCSRARTRDMRRRHATNITGRIGDGYAASWSSPSSTAAVRFADSSSALGERLRLADAIGLIRRRRLIARRRLGQRRRAAARR